MINIQSILNDHRTGDFEKRLTLFLDYRDIRNEFIKIHEEELRLGNAPSTNVAEKTQDPELTFCQG